MKERTLPNRSGSLPVQELLRHSAEIQQRELSHTLLHKSFSFAYFFYPFGFAAFKQRPNSEEVTAALDQIIEQEQVKPKHLIVDQGGEFKCEHFEDKWCKQRGILPWFGAVNKHGSIAVVERFHRTLKEILQLTTIPEDQSQFEREVTLIIDWYNDHRPHNTLEGKTPNEVYFSRTAASEQPRHEPRERWPRGSPCAKPQTDVDGDPGDPIVLEIDCLEGRRQLPIIRTRRAA